MEWEVREPCQLRFVKITTGHVSMGVGRQLNVIKETITNLMKKDKPDIFSVSQ